MKNIKDFLLLLLALILLTSCFEDDYTISCVEVTKVSEDYPLLETSINTSENLEFKLLNVCDLNTRINELKIKGENSEDFTIQGVSIGDNISKNGTFFTVIFTPTKLGTRKATIIIRHDTGKLEVSISGKGI